MPSWKPIGVQPELESPPAAPRNRPASASLELDAVYRQHAEFVWRNARRLGCSAEWVDDAVHEVFLVVAEHLNEFQARSSLRTWLFAITFRVVQRLRRNRSRYFLRLLRLREHSPEVESHEPFARDEAGRELCRILAHLNEAKRAVFILSELEGMTTPEIAQCLGLRPGTVDSRLRAARLELQAWVKRQKLRERKAP